MKGESKFFNKIRQYIPEYMLDTGFSLEQFIVGIIFIAMVVFLTLSSYFSYSVFEDLDKLAILILATTITLGWFIRIKFKKAYERTNPYVFLKREEDVKRKFFKMLYEVESEILSTHISALKFSKDELLEVAENKDTTGDRIQIERIIFIQNKNDLDIAKKTLELKEKAKSIDVNLYICDCSEPHFFNGIPNVVIRDRKEALLIFPSRDERRTSCLHISDTEAVAELVRDYWLKVKGTAKAATKKSLTSISKKIKV